LQLFDEAIDHLLNATTGSENNAV